MPSQGATPPLRLGGGPELVVRITLWLRPLSPSSPPQVNPPEPVGVAMTVEEEEGSSNASCDCAATSRLQVASAAARVQLQEEEDGAVMYTAVEEKGSSGME
ncbi:hypothetical protein B296_00004168 [Ensete ventricosum]|uniref:Uncharacterized protein n=1 Tax=Ensete ventricosum TaxID=4639 RepID=A0A426YFH6_ENSVE|nr:hypothetical protein B296_00004168 [Ensete ventricosum]